VDVRNSSRTWLRRVNASFAASIPAGSIVLDAGAGDQPYRSLFSHCSYEAADFERVDKVYAVSTYVCDLASIPVPDNRFDAIVFNQVMEHLPDPLSVLREFKRVLKPGGRMICSAPFFYEEHEQPYDYYRYTQFSWRLLMREAGFQIDSLEWLEGYWGTVAYQLETASRYLPFKPRELSLGIVGWFSSALFLICKCAFRAMAQIFYLLDERNRITHRGYPKNYVVLVTKP
jgi:SAM-dependent methyltransferase